MSNKDDIQKELKRIAKENGGLLKPQAVLEAAEAEDSPLHGCFQWDDSEAARAYRLWQARELIVSVKVEANTGGKAYTVQAYVSLPDDRKDAGGYRETLTVLSNRQTRSALLADALAELERVRAKYEHLQELAEVFSAVRRVRAA